MPARRRRIVRYTPPWEHKVYNDGRWWLTCWPANQPPQLVVWPGRLGNDVAILGRETAAQRRLVSFTIGSGLDTIAVLPSADAACTLCAGVLQAAGVAAEHLQLRPARFPSRRPVEWWPLSFSVQDPNARTKHHYHNSYALFPLKKSAPQNQKKNQTLPKPKKSHVKQRRQPPRKQSVRRRPDKRRARANRGSARVAGGTTP